MSDPTADRSEFNAEMERTAFHRKAVSRAPMSDVFSAARTWFQDRGYRVFPSGRPNQLFIMGGKEGGLPRVNGDILAVSNVGKGKVTMLTFNAVGERLSVTMEAFVQELRETARTARRAPTPEEQESSKS